MTASVRQAMQSLRNLATKPWRPSYMNDGLNYLQGARRFVEVWGAGRGHDSGSGLHTNAFGNINSTGLAGDYRSPALTKHQEDFERAIEPGVRPLVSLIVRELGWITYSSCQGHRYEGESLTPVERHVGILPRSPGELRDIRRLLDGAIETVGRGRYWQPVRPYLYAQMLDSDEGRLPVVDLVFRRSRLVGWSEYFRRLEDVFQATLTALRAAHGSAGRPASGRAVSRSATAPPSSSNAE